MSKQYHEQVSVCILCIALTDERDWWGGRGLDSGGGNYKTKESNNFFPHVFSFYPPVSLDHNR